MRTGTIVVAVVVLALIALGLVIAAVADRRRAKDVAEDPERLNEDRPAGPPAV